ncbi:MAG TPA: [acyl-carrier-protein] S-malonyltransferase [Verrucomicrobia bacterium]|nr:[acyl-carrier-protein] S-malonyltransferase [Verrucomicrobiota bacterium]HCG20393.1 [acyl-carrier-protein] S-malonyltransferase [Verrucomicrobiota bacterium]
MATCCMFAGQGAQTPGMGKDFAEADAAAMALFDTANEVLGFDLKKVCFEGPAEELTKSNVCQPAIFVTSYAAYQALQKKRPTAFDCAAGLSLGEWGALCAAGVLDFASTLKVLEARGRFMQEACEATPSGMIAIVGATPEQLETLCEKTGCTVANVNSAAQQVLSGSKEEIAAAAAEAKTLGIKRAIPLATAGGFHSPFMAPAREKLAPVLDTIVFHAPKFPVLSNVTGKPHASDPAAIKALMLEQVTGTTNWAADVAAAKEMGCTTFVEFGPGKVLSGLVKKIDASLTTANVSDLASLEATAALLG